MMRLEETIDSRLHVRRALADVLSHRMVQEKGFDDGKTKRQKMCPIETSDKLRAIARSRHEANDLA